MEQKEGESPQPVCEATKSRQTDCGTTEIMENRINHVLTYIISLPSSPSLEMKATTKRTYSVMKCIIQKGSQEAKIAVRDGKSTQNEQ